MAELTRRTLLRGAAAGTAAAGLVGMPAGAAAAGATAAGCPDVHETVARDAHLVWRQPPKNWQTAPFLGNGFLGAQLYQSAGNVLKVMLSHSQVQDQRVQWEAAIGLSRLPIGYLTLTLAGTVTAVDWQLDLWNAELAGTITTTHDTTAQVGGDGVTTATATALSSLSVTSVPNANTAMIVADAILDTVSTERGKLGAVQNRLAVTITNLGVVSEKVSDARSRIMDADFAAETANLTKNQILQTAGIAMLAQANSRPQAVLQLLQG